VRLAASVLEYAATRRSRRRFFKPRGVVPAALVLNAVNPIMVQGAAFAGFTMISGFDRDITQAIANGAMVEVDPTGARPFIRVL
jgi:predicted aconitase with swiveling domain